MINTINDERLSNRPMRLLQYIKCFQSQEYSITYNFLRNDNDTNI